MIDVNVMKAPVLEAIPGIAAAFVGRQNAARPDPASLVGCLGLPAGAVRGVVTAAQIHSDRVLFADRPADGGPLGPGDAIVTRMRGLVLGIATADCVPIVAGVLERTLEAMARQGGARMPATRIALGPSARVCCYRVGAVVTGAFAAARPDAVGEAFVEDEGGARMDLIAANRRQALDAGVPAGSIGAIDVCSICRPEVCHSYRRDGPATGRMWLLAALEPPATSP